MRRWLIPVAAVLVTVFIAYNLFMEWRDSIWQKPYNAAMAAYQARHYAEAERILLGALPGIERRWPNADPVAYQMYLLGRIFAAESKPTAAEQTLRKSIEIREKVLSPDSRELGDSYAALGRFYYDEGLYVQAEHQIQNSSRIFRKIPEAVSDLGISLDDLGRVYTAEGRYAEAEAVLKEALATYQRANVYVPSALNHLGDVYYHANDPNKAEEFYARALAILDASPRADPLQRADSISGLGLTYRKEGEYAKAEVSLQRAVEIYRDSLGSAHLFVVTALDNLALLYGDEGKLDRAESVYTHILDDAEKSKGPEDPDVASALENLGQFYRDYDKYSRAETCLKRALVIRRKRLGSSDRATAEAASELALLYIFQHNYVQAEPLVRDALPILEKAYGSDSLRISTALRRLGIAVNDRREASALLERALAIREKLLPPDHPWIAISLGDLGAAYQVQGRTVEAASLLRRAQEVRAKNRIRGAESRK